MEDDFVMFFNEYSPLLDVLFDDKTTKTCVCSVSVKTFSSFFELAVSAVNTTLGWYHFSTNRFNTLHRICGNDWQSFKQN